MEINQNYTPTLLRITNPADKKTFDALIDDKKIMFFHDEIYGQLQELIKSEHPAVKIKKEDYAALIDQHLAGTDIRDYGVWVYYPWSLRMVHLLDEAEFVEVRTNRNRYKITREEQNALREKKIGIVGLSVGQSIALTLAMERTCGELRLADFDTAELSNLNRIRTGVQNLGVNKAIIAAREILEIDPFIKVRLYMDGLQEDNMNHFFTANGKLDLFIEVCDGLDIKIESRYKAKEFGIPVVMDTNDRGMLDVERFDLEPDRPVLHGLTEGLDPKSIRGLSNEDKVPYILRMIGADTISTRMKASMLEVEQSINTWPQLASSVTLGGALTTDVCRRILLDQYHESGRYYIDLEDLVKDEKIVHTEKEVKEVNPYLPIERSDIKAQVDQYFQNKEGSAFGVTESQLNRLIDAAIIAPSAGNNQPWKWFYSHNVLFLFHDKFQSWSWGDYYEMGSHLSLGGALENVHIQAQALGLNDHIELFPVKDRPMMIAAIRFSASNEEVTADAVELAKYIYIRNTNRKLAERTVLGSDFYHRMENVVHQIDHVNLHYTEDELALAELADIIAECDKVRLLNQMGHEEFFHEIRWNKEEAGKTKNGVEIDAVDITPSEKAGFRVAQDWNAVKLLAQWDKGNAFKKMSLDGIKCASGIVVLSVPEFTHEALIEAGRAAQKAWIFACQQHVAVHPMLSTAFFFNRLMHGKGKELPAHVADKLSLLRQRFLKVFALEDVNAGNPVQKEVFLMKVSIAPDADSTSLRKDKTELFDWE
ncbi:putative MOLYBDOPTERIN BIOSYNTHESIS PROTEIN MOEY [Arcticibacter svalbardensis MN12-7]|uniref:Putative MOLYBDOPTERIN BIOSYNTHESIS PROTEIN MOEY n=1 Tax=Arcticibacter svalbardensis MN12-7 TaxID=1150600 RepID=R9GVB1_9SPHI|nr:Rv1355c family protein [Arcticibacter svalbardensis]EOR92879.1 putative MOLYBDOPTERIN BIOSYNTHESIS PROTEIN MOEY [Arcticibacter svalbardensis MN12-7]